MRMTVMKEGIIVTDRLLYGEKLEIHYSIRVSKQGKLTITIDVPIPENDDILALKLAKKLRKQNQGYGELYMSIKKENLLFLHKFYVRTSQNLLATDMEIMATKGLGLEMLCHATDLLLSAAGLPKSAYPSIELELEASGGTCVDEDFGKKNSREYLVNYLFNKPHHEEYFEEEPVEDWSDAQLGKVVCQEESNLKLVEYYKRFGLEPYETHAMYVTMRGKISKLISMCMKYIG